MPVTPQNNTPRLFVDYTGAMGNRSMQFRRGGSIDLTSHIDLVTNFVENAIAPFWYNSVQVTGARYSEANSNISLPVDIPPIQGQVAGTHAAFDYPEFLGFSGRGVLFGKQVALRVYGIQMQVTDNYRLNDSETVLPGLLLSAMQALIAADGFVTVTGDRPLLKGYLNTGYNAYFQRKARRSG